MFFQTETVLNGGQIDDLNLSLTTPVLHQCAQLNYTRPKLQQEKWPTRLPGGAIQQFLGDMVGALRQMPAGKIPYGPGTGLIGNQNIFAAQSGVLNKVRG